MKGHSFGDRVCAAPHPAGQPFCAEVLGLIQGDRTGSVFPLARAWFLGVLRQFCPGTFPGSQHIPVTSAVGLYFLNAPCKVGVLLCCVHGTWLFCSFQLKR